MRISSRGERWLGAATALLLAGLWHAPLVDAACCYFSAKDQDILQPAQKAFITWDPMKQVETFTVQPKFEGNALDFGMVIPTPTQPKLNVMPRDFFKHLAIYSILKKREFPQSKLLPLAYPAAPGGAPLAQAAKADRDNNAVAPRPPAIKVLEAGIVGSLEYKIIEAGRADDLFKWLKDNNYSYAGDQDTLDFYVQKKWVFTVMKIDTMQMKKNKDGSFAGEVTPTRFTFSSDKLVYPLKITQISVKDKTEALFYVQAPHKVDLEGDMSYQHTWIPMLQAAMGCTPGGIKGGGEQWLVSIKNHIQPLLKRNQDLGFVFVPGQRPKANAKGVTPTTMEWARRLAKEDIDILTGTAPYSEQLPNVDEGFTKEDLKDPQKREAVIKVIQARLAKANKERPFGYLVRHAPEEDLKALKQLAGHLQAGLFVTKFRKIFSRDEMNADLLIVPARFGEEEDSSEYQEQLPTSPP
jgi:hypothetical protein